MSDADRCVVCGEVVPEGRQVCLICHMVFREGEVCPSCGKRGVREESVMDMEEKKQKKVICPICSYEVGYCQCRFGGSAHPDRSKKRTVVLDHLYLFSEEQIRHIARVEKQLQISYADDEKERILKDLETRQEGEENDI